MSEAKAPPTPSGDLGGPPMPLEEPAPARAPPPPSGDLGGPPMPMDGDGGEEPQREGVLGRLRERAAETLERARDVAAALLPSVPGAARRPPAPGDLDFPETLDVIAGGVSAFNATPLISSALNACPPPVSPIAAVKSVEDPPADERRGERRGEGEGDGEAGARAKL